MHSLDVRAHGLVWGTKVGFAHGDGAKSLQVPASMAQNPHSRDFMRHAAQQRAPVLEALGALHPRCAVDRIPVLMLSYVAIVTLLQSTYWPSVVVAVASSTRTPNNCCAIVAAEQRGLLATRRVFATAKTVSKACTLRRQRFEMMLCAPSICAP